MDSIYTPHPNFYTPHPNLYTPPTSVRSNQTIACNHEAKMAISHNIQNIQTTLNPVGRN